MTLVAEQRLAMPMYPRMAADTVVIIAGVAITAVLTRHLDIGLRDNSISRRRLSTLNMLYCHMQPVGIVSPAGLLWEAG